MSPLALNRRGRTYGATYGMTATYGSTNGFVDRCGVTNGKVRTFGEPIQNQWLAP